MAAREWSQFQKDIFKFVRKGKGNAIIEAVAGSGKTTTIVKAMTLIEGSSMFLAFNKAIADELKDRGVDARTFHSLCIQPVLRAKPGRVVENSKTAKLFKEIWPNREIGEMYFGFVCKLVSLAKQNGIGCLREMDIQNFYAIIDHHEMELDHEDADLAQAVSMAIKLLCICNSHDKWIDFDDMLYLAILEKIKLPKFSYVFVDEAQDTNAIQRAILKKVLRKEGRLIAVGDPAQAIYGFRGSDSDSLSKIAEQFNCTRLPLSVSYRCPRSVVAHAQKWVSHILPSDTAELGQVSNRFESWKTEDFGPQDMIVCRTTKPLIALAYSMLKDRRPFYIMGREIGENLVRLIEKQKASNIDELEDRLYEWLMRETKKAMAKYDSAKADSIGDKYDSIKVLIESLPENNRNIDALVSVIDMLFAEKKNATVLCTIHKAKGLEANNVWWLNSSKCPAPWATGWQYKQEENLCYVATTRAKQNLYLIEERRQ